MSILQASYLPGALLVFWMTLAIILDLFTGTIHAYRAGTFRIREGISKTTSKFCQYTGAIAAAVILANVGQKNGSTQLVSLMAFVNDGLIMFIVYIEVRSILFHLVAIDPKSIMSKYLFTPMLRILTLSIKQNNLFHENNTAAGTDTDPARIL